MDSIQILGLAAGICTSSSVIPQLVKTIQEKKASDVSWIMFIVLIVGNSLWIYYGFSRSDIPIISTNIFSLMLNTAMLLFKWKYRKKTAKTKAVKCDTSIILENQDQLPEEEIINPQQFQVYYKFYHNFNRTIR